MNNLLILTYCRRVVQNVYHAQFTELDFDRRPVEAREQINGWVHTNTNGRIPQIISGSLPRNTNIILASVLYFKGFWENSFINVATISDDFYPDGPHAPPVKINMMATGGTFPFYDAIEYDCRIIGLPYRGNLTTMYIIQPNFSTRTKLRDLQRFLDGAKIDQMIEKMTLKSALLALPKMHFARSTNMKEVLNRLGITNIFKQGFSDFSLIGEQQNMPYEEAPGLMSMASQLDPTLTTKTSAAETSEIRDRFNETPLIFTRFGDNIENNGSKAVKRSINSPLDELEYQRFSITNLKSDFFVEDILHKVDFTVNEQGTEAAAATLTYLRRSGTDVLFRVDGPFLVLIRHDRTRLPLFYGFINEPQS